MNLNPFIGVSYIAKTEFGKSQSKKVTKLPKRSSSLKSLKLLVGAAITLSLGVLIAVQYTGQKTEPSLTEQPPATSSTSSSGNLQNLQSSSEITSSLSSSLVLSSAPQSAALTQLLADLLGTDPVAQLSAFKQLTDLGTPEAVNAIYNFTVTSDDPALGEEISAGLSQMTATVETKEIFLKIVGSEERYAYLAARPLMRMGREGTSALLTAIEARSTDTEFFERVTIEAAFDLSQDSRQFLTELALDNRSPAAQEILSRASVVEYEEGYGEDDS